METNDIVILGAFLGSFGFLLLGYLQQRKSRKFEARYILDAFIGTGLALPVLQQLHVEVAPGDTWWRILLLGAGAGIAAQKAARMAIKSGGG